MNKIRLATEDHSVDTRLPVNELNAPAYGDPQRSAINSVVDGLVGDICNDIGALRLLLDEIEKQILEGAAQAKHHLKEHVGVCVHVKDELVHMRRVITDIQEREKAARVS